MCLKSKKNRWREGSLQTPRARCYRKRNRSGADMSRYTIMFSPIKIGRMEIKNRVFLSPHGVVGLGIGTDRQVGHFAARATGGAGMMLIASCQVVPAPLVPPGPVNRRLYPAYLPAITTF